MRSFRRFRAADSLSSQRVPTEPAGRQQEGCRLVPEFLAAVSKLAVDGCPDHSIRSWFDLCVRFKGTQTLYSLSCRSPLMFSNGGIKGAPNKCRFPGSIPRGSNSAALGRAWEPAFLSNAPKPGHQVILKRTAPRSTHST